MASFQPFDVNSWDRREHFAFYSTKRLPHYAVAAYIDVTPLLAYKRKHHLSFYLSLVYLVTKSLNSIRNFRLRIVDGKVVIYDRIETNFTHKRPDEEIFRCYTAPFEGTLQEYVAATSEAIAHQTALFDGLGDIPNVVYWPLASEYHIHCQPPFHRRLSHRALFRALAEIHQPSWRGIKTATDDSPPSAFPTASHANWHLRTAHRRRVAVPAD